MMMLTDNLYCQPKFREYAKLSGKRKSEGTIVSFGTEDTLQDTQRRLGTFNFNNVETTNCSPVIPTAELTRIRNNVVAKYTTLRNNYLNVGSSLDSTGVVTQYSAVFDAMGDGNYCYYQSDQRLIDDINVCASGANQVLQNAFNQYANNFATQFLPIRNAYIELQSVAAAATNSVEPVLNAYNRFWSNDFVFHLHTGVNSTLDSLLADYNRLTTGSNTLFDQGINRVQGNFEAEVRQSNVVFGAFGGARNYWNKTDGQTGYNMYLDNIRIYQDSLTKLDAFVVLDTPVNKQVFAEIDIHITELKKELASFPNFLHVTPSTGFIIDPNTSYLKFFTRQAVLDLATSAGAHFSSQIAPGQSLIGTGFSYQHGGKMPPHAEHKDGKDCDIFSIYFKVGADSYDESKAVQMAIFLLNNNVTRLIYTNPEVVKAANAACPRNPVAVVGSNHETHLHFDLDTAT